MSTYSVPLSKLQNLYAKSIHIGTCRSIIKYQFTQRQVLVYLEV